MGLKLGLLGRPFQKATSCEPTYMGLKRGKVQHVLDISFRLRAYLYGIETFPSSLTHPSMPTLRAYLYGIETIQNHRHKLPHMELRAYLYAIETLSLPDASSLLIQLIYLKLIYNLLI